MDAAPCQKLQPSFFLLYLSQFTDVSRPLLPHPNRSKPLLLLPNSQMVKHINQLHNITSMHHLLVVW